MKFWIVTPSYNQLEWLKCCVASVADQAAGSHAVEDCSLPVDQELPTTRQQDNLTANHAIRVHHHIQDACSTDGTVEFLKEYIARQPATGSYQLTCASEADGGMYDALNRGWKLAPDDVDVIAHLNCDEQYLPNALSTVAGCMKRHPQEDVVLADMVVVDDQGEYICHRRSLKPYRVFSKYCCAGMTATTFHRASVTKEKKVFFDTSWKNFGDKVWYNDLHRAGCTFAVCHALVSVFTDTGENINWTDAGLLEKKRYEDEFLHGRSIGTTLTARLLGLRRGIAELFLAPPENYSLYLNGDPAGRVIKTISHPTGFWHKRW
ncbi:MAG: glycosyltransferase [Kiritimatiellales bacterium]